MVAITEVEEQLRRVGYKLRFWWKAEVRELANILLPEEIIAGCVNGRYEGGFATLAVTNLRLLLIDKKPMFLTLEDIRFDMIVEMDYSAGLWSSTIKVVAPTRTLAFVSRSNERLRTILAYTQQRVMEIRQPYLLQQRMTSPVKRRGHAPLVGGLAIRAYAAFHERLNPYMHVPMLMRQGTLPRFY